MSVLVDTSALYAALVRTEEGHAACADAFRALVEQGRTLLTTSYVLVETAALLQSRIGLPAVRDLEMTIRPLLEVDWIDATTHRRAVDRLLRLDRRRVSLVDACSFVVMDDRGVREALALDADFADQGYAMLPG